MTPPDRTWFRTVKSTLRITIWWIYEKTRRSYFTAALGIPALGPAFASRLAWQCGHLRCAVCADHLSLHRHSLYGNDYRDDRLLGGQRHRNQALLHHRNPYGDHHGWHRLIDKTSAGHGHQLRHGPKRSDRYLSQYRCGYGRGSSDDADCRIHWQCGMRDPKCDRRNHEHNDHRSAFTVGEKTMATIQPNYTLLDSGVELVTWGPVAAGDTCVAVDRTSGIMAFMAQSDRS